MMSESGAIYVRLSKEDGMTGTESESIANQKLFLMQYAAANGLSVGRIFSDDGISGTEWARPGLQAMLQSAASGAFRFVLVKDLSRLSRDYIRTGELLEHFFPKYGVRLISVSDGIDTGISSVNNDFSPFRAVMDDWYARDISKKVRAAIHARQLAGYCTAARLPYGYTRCGTVIATEPEQSAVILQIYETFLRFRSVIAVVRYLNEHQIPSPSHARNGWNDRTVGRILRNPAYFGMLSLHQTEKSSYKSHLKRMLPQEETVPFPVPPIVPVSLFRKVQSILSHSSRRKPTPHWLSGMVQCGVCGGTVIVSSADSVPRLICGARKRGMDCCNPSMRVQELEDQLDSLLVKDGFSLTAAEKRTLIMRLVMLPETVHVYLRYHPDR